MRRTIAALTLSLGIFTKKAHSQDSAAAAWRRESFAGSARVAIDVSYGRRQEAFVPLQSFLSGSAVVAPFLDNRWQFGVAPTFQTISSGSNRTVAGMATLSANFLPLTSNVSRPYLGATVMQGGASHTQGFGAYGAQGGWLHFLSPAIALRGEARYRRYHTATGNYEYADVFVTFEPYLFGRASRPITEWPSLGVLDAALVAQVELRPSRIGTLELTAAPFLTRWLQAGASASQHFYLDENLGDHYVELFGRAYLPVSKRFLPFGELFLAKQQDLQTNIESSHGGRAGVRWYLTPGVALDLAHEWRNFPSAVTPTRTLPALEHRTLRLTLRTQVRVARAQV